MSWREKLHYGHEVVAFVHDLMQVETEWSVDESDGFSWWPDVFCQTVWTDLGLFRNGLMTYRLHAETELVQGRDRRREVSRMIQHELDSSTLSACVYDAKSDTYKLHCSVFASLDNQSWLQSVFAAACALQLAEAKRITYNLVTQCRAIPAVGGHPRSGLRSQPNPMLQHVHEYFQPKGSKPSKWTEVAEWQEVCWCMEREAKTFHFDPAVGISAEFPWEPDASQSISLQIALADPHPSLGNGLHFTLMVPLKLSPDQLASLALEMDELERVQWLWSHMLGSWCEHEGKLAFRVFLPNAVFRPQQLTELSVAMAKRALWANDFFMAKYRDAQAKVAHSPTG